VTGKDNEADIPLPTTERRDAPLYLAQYHERRARAAKVMAAEPLASGEADGMPLYLRTFRARRANLDRTAVLPSEQLAENETLVAWSQTTKTKEIVPAVKSPDVAGLIDVHIIRHGETQGYSVDGGLSPMGAWQGRRRGHDLSKGIDAGSNVFLAAAPTARAMQTAEQIRRGIEDGLATWGRRASIEGPEPMEEFRNFQVWTPSGVKDPTQAFREYHAVLERYERAALGDRPLWLVEMDRFWRLQSGGGDPIAFWMTIPLLNFEPPAQAVLRFWAGIGRLAQQALPGTRFLCVTHSGPMRALAAWALGHDPGEPYNTEEVRVRMRQSLKEAVVTFRNRSQEVHVPPAEEWPNWWTPGIVSADKHKEEERQRANG
jgi:broad specificity phosphatase PhoE